MVDDEKKTTGADAHKNHHHTSGYGYTRQHAHRAISTFIVLLLILAAITALVLWLVYRPHKPSFTVVGATVYDLNTSSPPYISTTMQFTLLTRNPNNRVSIYYDHLAAFLSYKSHPITPPLMLPPLYHQRDSSVVVSPIFTGGPVPVSPEVMNGLQTDTVYGAVSLRVVLKGKLRWKGIIKTGREGVYVGCDVLIGFKRGAVGQVPLLGSSHGCKVDI